MAKATSSLPAHVSLLHDITSQRTLARFRTPSGPLQPQQRLLLAPVAGESPCGRFSLGPGRVDHMVYLPADLHLHHQHIASLVVGAATIHPRGLGLESQPPLFLLCFPDILHTLTVTWAKSSCAASTVSDWARCYIFSSL